MTTRSRVQISVSALLMIAFITILILATPVFANSKLEPFIGTWSIAYDQTISAAKKSPKYQPGDAEELPAMIKRLMKKMSVQISESSFSYVKGTKQSSFDMDLKKGDASSATAITYIDGHPFTLTFKKINDKYMSIKSSGSDNMDFYVWENTDK